MSSPAVKSAYLRWLAAALAKVRGATSAVAADGQDLVLGYATGYDVADIAIFVRSLRSHYKGAITLVVDDEPELRAFLKSHDVEAVDPPDVRDGEVDWVPHPVVSRFAGAAILLEQRPWVRNALLTDVRDVVFQGDPLTPASTGLEFYAECDEPLAAHGFNMKYIRAVAGESLSQMVADKPCICVGTVVGPRRDLIRFCRLNLMLGAIPRSEIGGAFGADQAICNLAVHLDLLEAEVRANHGRVATLGMVPSSRLRIVDGRIQNPDGSASPIVHQYDRHPLLMTAMWAQWAADMERRERKRPRKFVDRLERMLQSVRRRTVEMR